MTTIEKPFPLPEASKRKSQFETAFTPRNFEPLSSFANNGWMVAPGAPVVKKGEKILVNGVVVNPLTGLIEKAKAMFPSRIFDVTSYYIAFDTTNDQYVVVHKRTPLGESQWERANR